MDGDMQTFDSAKVDCQKKLQAIFKVIQHVGETADYLSKPDPRNDRITAEMRDALAQVSINLSEIMNEFVGPIWGLLPDDVTEACRQAGM